MPPDNQTDLVEFTGPTEAAVPHQAAEWLEAFKGAVVVNSTAWRGDISEGQTPGNPGADLMSADVQRATPDLRALAFGLSVALTVVSDSLNRK